MTRRELLRLLGIAPLGAAAVGLGIEAAPAWGVSPVQRCIDVFLEHQWREALLRHHNLILYGTSHPEYGTGPIVDWAARHPKVRSDLPPISWRTPTREEGGRTREVPGPGNSTRELPLPPKRGEVYRLPTSEQQSKEDEGREDINPPSRGSARGYPRGRGSGPAPEDEGSADLPSS